MSLLFIGARFERHQEYREGKVFGYQGEDQGQAEKGKPSKLIACIILVLLIA
jgi:hypothetical protein